MTPGRGRRRGGTALRLGLALTLTLAGATAISARAAPDRCGLSAEQAYAASEAAVVEVFSLSINQFRVSHRVLPSFGSGFVLGDGTVVTNYHVVADAGEVVVFTDRQAYDARVLGYDPLLDVALLQPTGVPAGAPSLAFADPASIRMGERVFPIGYPLGLGKTVSQGIVTGLDRVSGESTSSWLSPFLQTDAAINPGNSGGPLVDDCGKVVGMVARRLAGSAENVGFAIPADILAPVVVELKAQGHVSRPWHGLYGQMTTPAVLMILGVPFDQWKQEAGFMVETVEPGSAADTIGLRGGFFPVVWGGREFLMGGDIITEVNGVRIADLETALGVVRKLKVGDTVHIVFFRDGERHEASVTLPERPVLPSDLAPYRSPGVNFDQ